ncbi:universal stress protein [Actinoalloteichus caeruleus]|uniref:universal stress protein n=1 Tax=Actinoalloteichus cyanogriseus TaxID=2893586 RepID=UPI00054F6BA5|nr:universal stress protein [Actinoalloteichus caeruleus]
MRRIVIWVTDSGWRSCLSAATHFTHDAESVVLLHVIPPDGDTPAGGLRGFLGRGQERVPTQHVNELAQAAAHRLLARGRRLLGRGCETVSRVGRPEREVLSVCAGADLLVCGRDGRLRLTGPKSLAPATRFVVGHAPCAVLLVWPDEEVPAARPGRCG